MTPILLRRFAGVTLRTPPALRLARPAQIPPAARSVLRALRGRSDFGGVLVPASGRTSEVTALNKDAARLWRAFARPAALADAFPSPSPALEAAIAGLVLDGFLELHAGRGFISGIEAFPSLFDGTPGGAGPHRLGRIAVSALTHAAHLPHSDAAVIATHLYRFHTVPLNPSSRSSFRNLEGSGVSHSAGWIAVPARPQDAWTYWIHEGEERSKGGSGGTHKMYISPMPDLVRETLRTTLQASTLKKAVAFKTGRGPAGNLRPDKIVAYFERPEHMNEAARELTVLLAGTPAHGVPFSAAITDDGLLSWGVDPPADGAWLSDRESWRQWVTRSLGRSLAVARRCDSPPVPPWWYAVARLTVDGVSLEALSLADSGATHGAAL